MKGWKVTIKDYSGELHSDHIVYFHKDAAQYRYDLELAEASSYARSEEAPDVKFEEVDYEPIAPPLCAVGRVLHTLNKSTREEMVRAVAHSKLNPEECKALGL